VDTATLSVASLVAATETGANDGTNVDLALEWLQDDSNCTFTNPDHMREGDICIQEWMLYITPQANVCYATGEYTITYEASCFYGKDVCYMPTEADGTEITTVSFTFKVQTSKFCPEVVDQVDLTGTLAVTGRESFKPAEEGVEGATDGQFYLQGETLHFFATTASARAVITSTEVVMVQIRQDLGGLVQTGYRSVKYDPASEDMVVWTKDGTISDGTVTITTSDGSVDVDLMSDSDVYASGSDFGDYTFSETEAGFKMLIHAKAMPVNVDSFGSKSVQATLAVTYEAVGAERRRLLAVNSDDTTAKTTVGIGAWKPGKLPLGLKDKASMSMSMSLYKSEVNRKTARQFAEAIKSAIINGFLNDPELKKNKVYDEQVSIDALWTDGVNIWKRPNVQGFVRRLASAGKSQKIQVDFTFAQSSQRNALDLHKMMAIFEKQLVQPSSPLMTQEIFFGSVIHELHETAPSDYEIRSPVSDARLVSDLEEEKSASALAVPCLALLAGLFALVM